MSQLHDIRKAFEELGAQFDAAWNARDASALVALFTADGDMQFWTGKTISGRQQIELAYASEIFASMPPDMRHTTMLDRFTLPRPDVAIGDGSVKIQGTTGPDQPAVELNLLFTCVSVLDEGEWRIAAVRLMIPQGE